MLKTLVVATTLIFGCFANAQAGVSKTQAARTYEVVFGSINIATLEASLTKQYRNQVVVKEIYAPIGFIAPLERMLARSQPAHKYNRSYYINFKIAGAHEATCLLNIYGRDGGRVSVTVCRSNTATVRDVEVGFEEVGLPATPRAPSY